MSGSRYSIGWWDELFGDRTVMHIPQSDGSMRNLTVSKAWLKKMESEGKISRSVQQPAKDDWKPPRLHTRAESALKSNAEHAASQADKRQRVTAHIASPDGTQTREVRVGGEITEEQYTRHKDPVTGEIYALTYYEAGQAKTAFVTLTVWAQAVARMHELDNG